MYVTGRSLWSTEYERWCLFVVYGSCWSKTLKKAFHFKLFPRMVRKCFHLRTLINIAPTILEDVLLILLKVDIYEI
jgi:hypothetical protein